MKADTSPFRERGTQNIKRVSDNKQKIKLSSSEISLQLLRSKDIGSTYKVEYLVNINSKTGLKDPSHELSLRDIDNISLKKAIMNNIKSYDQRYMELADFDHTKATFHLKVDKWLDDATRGLRSKKKMATFEIIFKLKQEPPRMILEDALRNQWSEFVIRKLKQWAVEKDRREKSLLGDIFPKSMLRSLRRKLTYMFDWSYDVRWNRVEAQLQSKWVIALLYATSKLTKKETLDKLQSSSSKYKFPTKVKKDLKSKDFSKKKWKKLIRKKFY